MDESVMACIDRQMADDAARGLNVAAITLSPLNRRRLSVEIADSTTSFAGGVWSIVTHYRGVPIHSSTDCGESIWLTSYWQNPDCIPRSTLLRSGRYIPPPLICPGCPLCTTTTGARVPLSEGLE